MPIDDPNVDQRVQALIVKDGAGQSNHRVRPSSDILDESTRAVTTVGYEHHEIHSNGHYFIEDFTTLALDAVLVGGTDNDWDTDDFYEINRSLSIIKAGCTVNDVGIRMGGQSGGDATNPNRGIPGGATRENELVLRPNTSYLFRFTSGVNGNIISYNAEFYEHTDKSDIE